MTYTHTFNFESDGELKLGDLPVRVVSWELDDDMIPTFMVRPTDGWIASADTEMEASLDRLDVLDAAWGTDS